ncbi:hypothetical protein [Streptomyces sp. P17]|uniref:SCO2400 family protein n=1 Tax=Streptomyces sp. P17 TaxID=3074716 RepID=UPI0028F3FEAB|nr:hypothetical protein [Streptomyces sp. P17]MDT9699256.1 hypothetical protein [Streptomyces sp. P17]
MDYCSTCRRHLNGALVCPGCGAYAQDIAPPMAMAPAAAPVPDPWHDEAPSAEEAYEETAAVPVLPEGRAARRRQRARWRKNQRRAVVATAVALVGGGLTVATLDRQSGDRAQAATAPDNTPMGATEEQATEPAPAASTPPGTRRSRPHTPSAQPSATNAPREQGVAVTPTTAQPRTPTSAAPTAASAAQSQPLPAITAAAPEPTATPTPTPPAPEGTATPSAPPSPSATSPSGLCLLVVCIN